MTVRTTELAVHYLTAPDARQRAHALGELGRICWRAKGYELFIAPEGVKTTAPRGAIQVRGQSLHKHGGKLDRNGNAVVNEWYEATREWIEVFLLEFFKPYYGLSAEQVLSLASTDAFRYIGRSCRLRMIDAVRKTYAQKRRAVVLDDRPITSVDESEENTTILGMIGQEPEDSGRSTLGSRPPADMVNVAKTLYRYRAGLEQLLGTKLFVTLKVECMGLTKGETTAEIARRLNVKARQATEYRKRLQAAMVRAADDGNEAVLELRDLLRTVKRAAVIIKPYVTPQRPRSEDGEALQSQGQVFDAETADLEEALRTV